MRSLLSATTRSAQSLHNDRATGVWENRGTSFPYWNRLTRVNRQSKMRQEVLQANVMSWLASSVLTVLARTGVEFVRWEQPEGINRRRSFYNLPKSHCNGSYFH